MNLASPIVDVTASGNYVIQGKRVLDTENLDQMRIPDHETCVQVTRSMIAGLLIGAWELEPISATERRQLLTACQSEALHLEMRDVYATDIEKDRFATWLRGEPLDPDGEKQWWKPWFELMHDLVARGVTMRRLRVISEPVSAYIHFEWLDSTELVRAGEDVRWLPRRNASTLMLPGNDFWIFDRKFVAFTHFSGTGHVLDRELETDSTVVSNCVTAFEEAWDMAIPHSDFTPQRSPT